MIGMTPQLYAALRATTVAAGATTLLSPLFPIEGAASLSVVCLWVTEMIARRCGEQRIWNPIVVTVPYALTLYVTEPILGLGMAIWCASAVLFLACFLLPQRSPTSQARFVVRASNATLRWFCAAVCVIVFVRSVGETVEEKYSTCGGSQVPENLEF